MREDHEVTLALLCQTINSTREGSTTNLDRAVNLVYLQDYEVVEIYYGYKLVEKVNVACDSPMAMCRDVLKARCFQ